MNERERCLQYFKYTKMNNTLQNNFSNICRSCLMESSTLKSLFSYEQLMNKKIPLCDMLMSCASIFVLYGDGLPENICLNCCQQVNTAYLFRKLCERSDATLRACTNMSTIDNSNIFTDQIEKYSEVNISLENKPINEDEVNVCNETIVVNEDCETVMINTSINAEPNYFIVDTDLSNINKDNFSIDSLDIDVLENNLFECEQCSMKFNTKTLLLSHKSEHTNNSFPSRKLKNRDGAVRKYNQPRACNICNKTFRFHSNLKRHKLTHTGEKSFLCNVCGKSFAQMAYLKIHLFIHTGEKPFKCQMCDRSFTARGTLMTHIRRHTGERPCICKICGKNFPQSGYLASHVRVHTGEKPLECKVCNHKFSQSGRLNTHMRIHSGEKPYQCTMCNKSFAVSGTLKKHIRTHTGERPYKCIVCDQAFAQGGTLNTHMRIHKPKTDNDNLISWT